MTSDLFHDRTVIGYAAHPSLLQVCATYLGQSRPFHDKCREHCIRRAWETHATLLCTDLEHPAAFQRTPFLAACLSSSTKSNLDFAANTWVFHAERSPSSAGAAMGNKLLSAHEVRCGSKVLTASRRNRKRTLDQPRGVKSCTARRASQRRDLRASEVLLPDCRGAEGASGVQRGAPVEAAPR